MSGRLVDPSEGAEIGPERCARSFTTMAGDVTAAIPLVIPGPCVAPVAHGGVRGVAAVIALPLVRREPRLSGGTWSAISAWPVRVSACSHTQQRGSLVSREITLMMGGRSLASVPCPLRLLARRRGGSAGSGCGVLLFPGVLVPCVGLTRRASHHIGWGGLVQVRLHALAPRVPWRA